MNQRPSGAGRWVLVAIAIAAAGALPSGIPTAAASPAGYGLDDVDRAVSARGRVRCPKVPMTRYAGDVVRYHSPVWVYTGFVERLRRFETIVADVATEVYGRPPRRIRHIGTFNCRRIGGYPTMLSEHALGNGIDVAGFDFGALPRRLRTDSPLPRRLKRGFKVRLADHWRATGAVASVHARFLDRLARRLAARRDVFRVLLGPSYPGHRDHFHFDVGPFRLVDMWEPGAAPLEE